MPAEQDSGPLDQVRKFPVLVEGDTPLEVYTNYLDRLKQQGVSADERAVIARNMLRNDLSPSDDGKPVSDMRQRVAAEEKAEEEARAAQRKGGAGVDGVFSFGHYRTKARGEGLKGSAQLARARELQREDVLAAEARDFEREKFESEKAYKQGIISRAERDNQIKQKEYMMKEQEFLRDQEKLTPDQVLTQGNTAMTKLYQNQPLVDGDIPALLAYRKLMMQGGGDDPLITLGLDEDQVKEVLYGSHKVYPSFTKKKDIDKKTARDLLSKGQDKVFRYGTLVDLKELIGEGESTGDSITSESPKTLEEMRNLVAIADLQKQLESASPRNKESIKRQIAKLTGR